MDTAQIVVAVMWFFAAMVGGICGLGPAMMAVPVISFFVPIKTDILITCLIAPFASILLVLMHLRFCRWRSMFRRLTRQSSSPPSRAKSNRRARGWTWRRRCATRSPRSARA